MSRVAQELEAEIRAGKRQCTCNNIDPHTYDNTIILGYYPVMREYRDNRAKTGLSEYGICVDRCLADEIIELWEADIRTYGCCCGHNKIQGFINVGEEDFQKALDLGYTKYAFPNDPTRNDTIIPKSVGRFVMTDKHPTHISGKVTKVMHTVLSNNIKVQAMLGKPPRIYDDVPDAAIYPYLTFGPYNQNTMTIHIWSQFSGRKEVDEIINILSNVLEDDLHLTAVLTDVFRAPDGHTLHGIIRIKLKGK